MKMQWHSMAWHEFQATGALSHIMYTCTDAQATYPSYPLRRTEERPSLCPQRLFSSSSTTLQVAMDVPALEARYVPVWLSNGGRNTSYLQAKAERRAGEHLQALRKGPRGVETEKAKTKTTTRSKEATAVGASRLKRAFTSSAMRASRTNIHAEQPPRREEPKLRSYSQ